MIKLNLKDRSLYYLNSNRYQNSLVSDRYSKYFSWTSGKEELPTFYTYTELRNLGQEKDRNVILLESSAIIPDFIQYVYANANKFNHIYTHNSSLLKLKNSRWIPGGGIWIGTEFGGGENAITNKTKLCSFVSSDKNMCELHRIRYDLAKILNRMSYPIDFYGTAFGQFSKASEYLQDYMFSVIVENYVDDYYFTEKLLNCFACGVIPIYLGARKISSVFDPKGIIQFSSAKDFIDVFGNVSKEFYEERKEAIVNNYNICQKYACIEDFMWENYLRFDYECWNNS